MKTEKIFILINDAKNQKNFLIANIAMGILLENAKELGLFYGLETQDKDGEYSSEVYYDLVLVETDDKRHSACIPVPLLYTDMAVAAVKAAYAAGRVYDRKEHTRETCAPSEEEKKELFLKSYETFKECAKSLYSTDEISGISLDYILAQADEYIIFLQSLQEYSNT